MARPTKDKAIDWDAVERQYRLGRKSNTQLAKEFSSTVSSVGRRAKKYGWVVDKSEEVTATTNSLLIQNASGNANPNATPTALEIKVAATVAASVVVDHRVDIRRGRKLFQNLMAELEITTDNLELFEQLGELMDTSGPDASGNWKVDKQNELYKKVITLTGRVGNAKQLVETLEKLVRMERQAFGIDDAAAQSSPLDEMLKKLSAQRDVA